MKDDSANLFYSPYSISLALAMTYAGARTATETEMANTMHFALGQNVHPAFNALDLELASRAEESEQNGKGFKLNIANAIYFKAAWAVPFEPENTQNGAFHLAGGGTVDVPMMHGSVQTRFMETRELTATEIPYEGHRLSLLLVVPGEGQLDAFESELDADRISAAVSGLRERIVTLTLPKFSFTQSLPLAQKLQELGMPSAFGAADFSGMDGTRNLVITDVLHKAFVGVNEAGTEAAAATAVIVGETSAPEPATFIADRPFLFFIRDNETGAILFVGRVMDPSQN